MRLYTVDNAAARGRGGTGLKICIFGFSWKTFTMDSRAPEQDVHVSLETAAELRVRMLKLVKVSSVLET